MNETNELSVKIENEIIFTTEKKKYGWISRKWKISP
jgi:hypothetical protein